MKRILPLLLCLLLLTGCGGNTSDSSYEQITQEAGAVLLPVGTIDDTTAAQVIPEKDSTVLVYCRSGNRSKTASAALADLGYTNIYELGGINTWPYDTEP